jgi:hypothetical protein
MSGFGASARSTARSPSAGSHLILADTTCPRCKSPLRLIALIKTEDTIKKILSAMGLPTEAPKPYPARPPPSESGGEGGDWLN